MSDRKCKDRVKPNFEDRIKDIRMMYEQPERYHKELGHLHEYGLCMDLVESGTFSDEQRAYKRWQISWGGPSDEFRVFEDGTVEYWFLDWYDGASVEVLGDDADMIKDILYNVSWGY